MLDTIYITRHGFRSNWTTDPKSGEISSTITSPTGIPSDPPLAAHGVEQSKELATKLLTLSPAISQIYTSPFYRCLETVNPFAEAADLSIIPDNGIGEWYGVARFTHPRPAHSEILHKFFPRVDVTHEATIIPNGQGETVANVHDRTAYALAKLIGDIDRLPAEEEKGEGDGEGGEGEGRGPRAILICTHAATNIAAGRALTGDENLDVKTGTCSLGVYKRRVAKSHPPTATPLPEPSKENPIPEVGWRGGKGVAGGWDIVVNGDCSFLRCGEERNWWFQGEEDWDFPVVKEGMEGTEGGLTAAVEGGNKSGIGGPGTLDEAGKKEAVAELIREAKI